tara:strand:- start:340 stop:702 length:363 start_codon:yes stop_codon:yes gene_type:complete
MLRVYQSMMGLNPEGHANLRSNKPRYFESDMNQQLLELGEVPSIDPYVDIDLVDDLSSTQDEIEKILGAIERLCEMFRSRGISQTAEMAMQILKIQLADLRDVARRKKENIRRKLISSYV